MKRRDRRGFTIIELMIATVVFSLVLLIIMGAIIQFGRIYYKGVIQSRTQERTRAISEDIARHIQFGKNVGETPEIPTTAGFFCAGGRGYTYRLGQERIGNQHGLVATNTCANYAGMSVGALSPGATEMLGERMQLTKLSVRQVDGIADQYTISVRVVYGTDNDFEGTPANPDGDPTMPCKSIALGGQFCAVSELTTTVTKRLK